MKLHLAQPFTFTVKPQLILLLLAGYVHHSPHRLLVVEPVTHEHLKQLLHIQPVGLGPTLPPVDFDAGWIDDQVLDAMRRQKTVDPEPVAAGLVATDHWCLGRQPQSLLRACHFLQESAAAPGTDVPLPDLAAVTEAQLPGGVAQLQRHV